MSRGAEDWARRAEAETPMAKRLKVALVMGGGVSLGAFSGGALVEVVRQLAQLERRKDPYDDVVIDVLAGASAGGITLALLLASLSRAGGASPEDLVREVERTQRRAWVTDVSLETLLPRGTVRSAALLDRRVIARLAEEELLPRPDGTARPHPLLADRVCLGLTLLNYEGIPILGTRIAQLQDALSTVEHADERTFCFEFDPTPRRKPLPRHWVHVASGDLQARATWEAVAETAMAGGAFPLAFEPVSVERRREEYPRDGEGADAYRPPWPEALDGRASFPFSCGDGGTFDNEPLNYAFRMASALDAGEEGESERLLIFVDPNLGVGAGVPVTSIGQPWTTRPRGPRPTRRLLESVDRLTTAVRQQAAFKDYVRARRVNRREALRKRLLPLLYRLVHQAGDDAARWTFEQAAALRGGSGEGAALEALEALPEEARMEGEIREACSTSDVHVAAKDPSPYARAAEVTMEAAVQISLLVEEVAGLADKREASILAIAPVDPRREDLPPVPLAGGFLKGFGGFFHRAYREHDFAAGRFCAWTHLAVGTDGRAFTSAALAPPPEPQAPRRRSHAAAKRRMFERGLYLAPRLLALFLRGLLSRKSASEKRREREPDRT